MNNNLHKLSYRHLMNHLYKKELEIGEVRWIFM
jgi:hypothetical protein